MLGAAMVQGVPAMAAGTPKVDLILYNARVLTVDRDFSIRSAVAVRGDRIVAVGGNELRRRFRAARAIDLKGQTLMPGFTDTSASHARRAQRYRRGHGAQRRRGAGHAAQEGRGTGAGQMDHRLWLAESNLAENRNLSRADLDAAAPANPVMLIRAGGHSSVSNAAALKIAGIDRSTPDPKAG
jgi:predicted amidohydrolase YtcJ